MGYTDWMIKTRQLATCGYNFGFPCEFSVRPARTPCKSVMAIAHEPDPVFADIGFEWGLDNATERFAVEGMMEAKIEPNRNPVTGVPHRLAIRSHTAYEFREAEMASIDFWSKGEFVQEHAEPYAYINYVSCGPRGLIDEHTHPAVRA